MIEQLWSLKFISIFNSYISLSKGQCKIPILLLQEVKKDML